MGYKWDIKRLSDDNDFELWKGKIQPILTQSKCVDEFMIEALMLARLTQAEKPRWWLRPEVSLSCILDIKL